MNTRTWSSKNIRKAIIRNYPLYDIMLDILINSYIKNNMPLLSFCQSISISDEMGIIQNIQTVMELCIIIANNDLLDIYLEGDKYYVQPFIELPEELTNRLVHTCYIPPRLLPYEHKGNVILGGNINNHSKDKHKSLDVLETLGNQQFVLDNWFLENHEKKWFKNTLSYDEYQLLTDNEKQEYDNALITWNKYKEQFKVFVDYYKNKVFYFDYKYDKRGRVYSMGYHLNSQGTSFEKASLSLRHSEIVTGEL